MTEKKRKAILKNRELAVEGQNRAKNNRVSKYDSSPNLCTNCSSKLNYSKRKNKFCSKSCAASYNNKNRVLSKETKTKISNTLTKPLVYSICKNCNIKFSNKRGKECCSISCARKLIWQDEVYRNKMSQIASIKATERHKDGDESFGWQSRKGLESSYPEKLAESVLVESGVKYEKELKVGKYFIDFAILDYNIALEIDGQQHNLPERKLSDVRKDKLLVKEGWEVIRIKYPEEHIKDTVKDVLVSISSR